MPETPQHCVITKAGVIALNETLAAEMREHDVRVTVLCPAFFRTNLLETARSATAELAAMGKTAFAQSTMSADAVAAAALRAVARGQLYCLPMREGRLVWRFTRALTERYARLLSPARMLRLAKWGQPVV